MNAGDFYFFTKVFSGKFFQRPPGPNSKRFFEIWEPVGGLDFRTKGLFFIVKGGGGNELIWYQKRVDDENQPRI